MKKQKIAVLGCGPGGMAAALFLARCGHEPVLFERFESPQPVGSGLLIQPSGQHVLQKLGLLMRAQQLSAPVERLFGISVGSNKRALDMEYRHLGASTHALGIHRANLFSILFDAVKAQNIEIYTGHEVTGSEALGQFEAPIFKARMLVSNFDLILDASGAHSPLASGQSRILPYGALWTTVDLPAETSIGRNSLDQRYRAARQMAGIMPIGVNPATGNPGAALFWSVAKGKDTALRECGIAKWRQDLIDLWPQSEPFASAVTSFDMLTLASYHHRTGTPNSSARVFHIGDSWHSTSPQLGQGANMALVDAMAFARALEMSDSLSALSHIYRHYRSDHVRLYQALSAVFTPLYQSDSSLLPFVRDQIIHYAARMPLVRGLIAKIVSGNFGNALL